MPARIALIGPEGPQRQFLTDNLACDGFEVTVATLPRAVDVLSASRFDGAVIDSTENSAQALRLLVGVRNMRHHQISNVLPMFLVAEDHNLDVLRWFELGADDVSPAPVNYPIVRARLSAVLRRDALTECVKRDIGALTLDTSARSVAVNGERVGLGNKEYELFVALSTEPDRVFTKPDLMKLIWRTHLAGTSRTLDSHACRLRKRLAEAGAPNHVVNVWGVGYRLR